MSLVILQELLDRCPPEAQALIRILMSGIAERKAEVGSLRSELARQGKPPQYSSLPPGT
jgi:hypothetical protein